jgi:hypothetical protein
VKKIKHEVIKSLGTDYVQRIEAQLVRGQTPRKVAEMVHGWGVLEDQPVDTTRKQIERYFKDEVEPDLEIKELAQHDQELVDPEDPMSAPVRKGKKLLFLNRVDSSPINVLEKLNQLFVLQESRVMKIADREANLEVLMGGVGKEIETLHKMGMDISRIQMDMGHLRRVPKKISIEDPRMLDSRAREAFTQRKGVADEVGEAVANIVTLLEHVPIEEGEYTEVDDSDD